jgi:hypothetical protein
MPVTWTPDHVERLLELAEAADRIVIGTAYLSANPLVNVLLRRARTVPVIVVAGLSAGTDRVVAEALSAAGAEVLLAPAQPGGGRVHAKIYGFVRGDAGTLVVGSGNLTGATYFPGGNVEVFMEEPVAAATIIGIEHRLRSLGTVHDLGELPDTDAPATGGAAAPGVPPGLLQMSWAQFVAAMSAQNAAWKCHWGDTFGEGSSWFDTLSRLRTVARGPIAELSLEQRKVLAGAQLRAVNPAFFGNLSAAGTVNGHLIRADTRSILSELDAARRSMGEIGEPLPIPDAMRAFERIANLSGFGFASASRLLGAVRPDIFVILNNASIQGLNTLLAYDPFPNNQVTPANLARYARLLGLVRGAPWWGSPRPHGPDAFIWEGRALLLDAFVYDDDVG